PADGDDSLVIQYQIRVLGAEDVIRFDPALMRDWNLGIVMPAKVAQTVKTSVKPVRVPAPLLKRILAKSERDATVMKDSLLLQYKNTGKPVELAGLPPSKAATPAYLVLTRTSKKAAGGKLNVVQAVGKRILGGNTFVIAMPRKVLG